MTEGLGDTGVEECAQGSPDSHNGHGTGTFVRFDPNDWYAMRTNENSPYLAEDPVVFLAHEVFHAYEYDRGIHKIQFYPGTEIKTSEVWAVVYENLMRAAAGMDRRDQYGGKDIPKHLLR